MSQLSIALLGHFQVSVDDQPVSFPTDKAGALLAYLAVEKERAHRRDALAGLLWPDQPQDNARQSLRQALSHLRQAIAGSDKENGQPFLLVTRQTIQFNAASEHCLDVAAFQSLVEACRNHQHRRLGGCLPCLRRLREMADLYRSHFLDQFFLSDSAVFEEWAVLQREWLRREVVEALIVLTNYHERRGEHEAARRYAQRQVTFEPWREEAHRQLMRIFAAGGQRSAALAQYETCRQTLAAELNVEPVAETQALYAAIREERPVEAAARTTLPRAATPFVGRARELDEIAEMLANEGCRLVTIFGPGGIGKTRLALQVGEDQVGVFRDGVAFASLLNVTSPAHIFPAIADGLQISSGDAQSLDQRLFNYLKEKELLLVLDNFEHLVDGGPLLADLLHQAPDLVLLVASREKLNLREEWVYEVEGLTRSSANAIEIEACDAADLFEQCACRVDRTFALSEQNRAAMARICQLVEGMPLAIELAAAWVTVHTCQQIARELAREIEGSLEILTSRMRDAPPRHRNIRATFEHSWQLLDREERGLLSRLSIFRGGFGSEAAAKVAGATPEGLLALLDKALIRRGGPNRYDIHEMLRQYAIEKLRQDPQTYEMVRLASARHFAAFLETQGRCLQDGEAVEGAWKQALMEIGRDLENSRQALFVAVSQGDVEMVEQCLEGLHHFHVARCRFREGYDILAQAIDVWPVDAERGTTFARLIARRAIFDLRLGRYQQAQAALEDSLATFQRLGNVEEEVSCLVYLADVLRKQGQYAPAEQIAQRCLALSRRIDDAWGEVRSLYWLGLINARRGEIERAKAFYEEGLSLSRPGHHIRVTLSLLSGLGDVICHQGDYAEARAVFEKCVTLSRDLEGGFTLAVALNNLGTVLHLLEKYEEARPYYEESLKICREIGDLNGQAVALSNLGEIAFTLKAYQDARSFYRAALSIGRKTRDRRAIIISLNNLGEIACALGDYPRAQSCYAEALRTAADIQALPMLLNILFNLARFFTEQGEAERTSLLLDVVQAHPASERAIQQKAQELRSKMNFAPLGDVARSLDDVIAETLAEIESIRPAGRSG
ncbi:MAG TPA: tetratricopeptide repeat protein [Chloroflexi bacterium]|nr:tetratricopeptide repeat protein [Chloroflexota bacterium]